MSKAKFFQYLDPEVKERLKIEAKKQRRSAASLCEYILDKNLPSYDNSSGNSGKEPGGKADR